MNIGEIHPKSVILDKNAHCGCNFAKLWNIETIDGKMGFENVESISNAPKIGY